MSLVTCLRIRKFKARSFSKISCLLLAIAPFANAAHAQTAIWPVTGANSHQMLTGYADGAPENTYGFHEGIDIWVDGKGGQDVVAMRKGKVLFKNAGYQGGSVTIAVDLGGGVTEWDRYLHVGNLDAGFAIGDTIDAGTKLGVISTTKYDEGSRHLHVSVLSAAPPDASAPAQTTERNPFLRFAAAADRDPLGKTPKLLDINGDMESFLITKSGDPTAIAKQTISGEVDFIADGVDPMNDTLKFPSAPFSMGYYVEPLYTEGVGWHGVKNDNAPYQLYRYDDQWFADTPYADDADKGKLFQVYDKSREVAKKTGPNPTDFPFVQSAILTNTKGTNGRVANVDKNQYWKTDAKDDGAADTVDYANYASKPKAANNAEARFKDGEYEIHVTMNDASQSHGADVVPGKLRLDNFKQTALPGKGGQAPDITTIFNPLYHPDADPYVPKFEPVAQTAGVDLIFKLGEMVGITGMQYYPSLAMPAYIFPHKATWNEGDEYQGWTQRIAVLSDAMGAVPLTAAWNASMLGHYDVLIDYNRDGVFSWTLDGLGGFRVVPEPTSLLLFVSALIMLSLGRRRGA